MASPSWTKIEIGLIENPPARLEATDTCYAAREYASGKGFQHSETNSLISNLKKPVCDRGKPGWPYKDRAIRQFAAELQYLLSGLQGDCYLAPIPSSKRTEDPEYDRRIEDVIDIAVQHCSKATKAVPVVRSVTLAAAHLSGGSRPSPIQVRGSLSWAGFPGPPRPVIFLDDVITTGTTFKECQRLVLANANVEVVGVFWARTVWDTPEPPVSIPFPDGLLDR